MATLLIADDESINRKLLRAYLAEGGHEIHEAADGDRALEIAASTPIDLALLDVLMPGMDGFETARRLKAGHADRFRPIVLVTALTDQPSRRLRFGNTGTPIPVHLREHVFEKHGQAGDRRGRANLGLGLYFCRVVAGAHGGRIWIEETPELPTVFVFEIPKRRRAALRNGDAGDGS